jgi:hypothetical protein
VNGSVSRWAVRALAFSLVLLALALVFARCVDRDLNHDEHQFLAPAALVGREGLMPWHDFPLFHLPNLVFAYAAADRWTGDLILGAKLVGFVATAALILGLAVAACCRARWQNLLLAATVLGLLLTNPLFLYTEGKTWNHEVPTALLLGSGALLIAAASKDRLWLTALAGILGGLAAGCRLTFAPALLGLALFVWLQPAPSRRRLAHFLTLTFFATLALAPALMCFALQPEAFVFGNFEFPRLRLSDPSNSRIQKTVSLWRKVRYFLKEILIGGEGLKSNLPVFALWAAIAVEPGWAWLRRRAPEHRAAGLWLILFPFLLLGCFAPARYQFQHYYVFVPLVLAGVVSALSIHTEIKRYQLVAIFIGVVSAAVMGYQSADEYAPIRNIAKPGEWFPERVRLNAEEIRSHTSGSRILTLGPAYTLSGGLRIYPQFATGAFAWRSASLVPAERRQRLHLVAPEDLESLLLAEPPSGILTGVEDDEEEAPLIAWAKAHGYTRIPLKRKRSLWVPPQHP